MQKSSLCDCSDSYILVSGSIAQTPLAAGKDNNNIQVVFKNCAPFTDCISKINKTQINNAEDTDVVMPMHNLIKYSDNYLKTSGSLLQFYRDEPALNDAGAVANFPDNSASFKYKQKIAGETGAGGIKILKQWCY